MRIMQIITRLIHGGAQQTVVQMCDALVKAGHEVHLVYGPIYGPEGSLLPEAKRSGASLHEIRWMRRAVLPPHDALCYHALRKLIRRIKPDIVHTHSSKAGIVGRAAAWAERANGLPKVLHTVHGVAFHERQPRWLHHFYVRLERYTAKRCDHLIAVSPAMVDLFEQHRIAPREKFSVIPSGIDLKLFDVTNLSVEQAKQQHGFTSEQQTIGLIARIDPLKGHRDLIDITPQIASRTGNVSVCFVGDGWYAESVRQHIADSSLHDRFKLKNLVPFEQMPSVYRAMDVVVLPSYQEGQSRVLAEALLCGCGIVAYDVGGIGSLCIEGETGRLVPRGDKSALADAIVWMLEHPRQRAEMSAGGAALVRERFSMRTMVDQIASLYDMLLAKREQDGQYSGGRAASGRSGTGDGRDDREAGRSGSSRVAAGHDQR